MTLEYIGRLDELESCYPYEIFARGVMFIYIQSSSRFGSLARNYLIEDPAVFVEFQHCFYRYILRGVIVKTNANGHLIIDETILNFIESKFRNR